jgi:Uma2 family endonuclease
MAMPATPTARRYTVEEVLAFPPDRNRYEVVHGELLVTPSPAPLHQVVRGRITTALVKYLDGMGMANAFLPGPVDYFHGSDVYVQPDLVVVWPEEITANYRTMRRLRLVVEVISPSSARGDRLVKRGAYQDAGAETYWVVDPDHAVVEVWHPGDEVPELAARELTWRVTPESAPLILDLSELFARLPV